MTRPVIVEMAQACTFPDCDCDSPYRVAGACAQAAERAAPDLHAAIMNLCTPAEVESWPQHRRLDYKAGHRDARHAAAELAAVAALPAAPADHFPDAGKMVAAPAPAARVDAPDDEHSLFLRDLRDYLLHVIDMSKGEHYLDVVRENAAALLRRMQAIAAPDTKRRELAARLLEHAELHRHLSRGKTWADDLTEAARIVLIPGAPAAAAVPVPLTVSTAPTDRELMLWSARRARWDFAVWGSYQRHNHPIYTHWMPLPDAPAGITQQPGGAG